MLYLSCVRGTITHRWLEMRYDKDSCVILQTHWNAGCLKGQKPMAKHGDTHSQPPGMFLTPCKWWGFQLPTSSGKRRISAINTKTFSEWLINRVASLPFQVLNNWWMPVTGIKNGTGDGYRIHVHKNLLSVILLYTCVIGFKRKHGRSHSSSLKYWRGSSHISSYWDAQNGGISHTWQGQRTPVPPKI